MMDEETQGTDGIEEQSELEDGYDRPGAVFSSAGAAMPALPNPNFARFDFEAERRERMELRWKGTAAAIEAVRCMLDTLPTMRAHEEPEVDVAIASTLTCAGDLLQRVAGEFRAMDKVQRIGAVERLNGFALTR